MKQLQNARDKGDEDEVEELAHRYNVDSAEAEHATVRRLFGEKGPVRRQLVMLSVVWLFYASSFVAANSYITNWPTRNREWSSGQTGHLLLVAAGIGILFYLLGGFIGEQTGRRAVLIGAASLVAPLNLLFYFFHQPVWWGWLLYIAIYQVTNGTWSGAGYAYWGESFPTEVRGTAVGWLGGMFALGLLIGSGVWTILQAVANPNVTWLVVAVGLALGQLLSVFLRRIEPGQELEQATAEGGSGGASAKPSFAGRPA